MLKKKHIVADDFSRWFQKSLNDIDENINDFIDEQFNCVRVCFVQINEKKNKRFLKDEYSENSQKIAHYFIILFWSNEINRKKFYKFKNWILQFFVRDKHLFKRINKNVLLRKIINDAKNQIIILKQFHDENEHRECE